MILYVMLVDVVMVVMKNSDCTIGLRRLCNQPYCKDGTMIKLIRSQGGIPYCKTNCPQLNMLPESCNNIIGATNNPYNIENVPGGSSAGEAALIACGVSKLGIKLSRIIDIETCLIVYRSWFRYWRLTSYASKF